MAQVNAEKLRRELGLVTKMCDALKVQRGIISMREDDRTKQLSPERSDFQARVHWLCSGCAGGSDQLGDVGRNGGAARGGGDAVQPGGGDGGVGMRRACGRGAQGAEL